MEAGSFVPSIAAVKHSLGGMIADHLNAFFNGMMRGKDVCSESGFVRLMTGEPHPFGNLLLLKKGADPDAIADALEPIVKQKLPSIAIAAGLETPPAIAAGLAKGGYESFDQMPTMAMDLAGLSVPVLPEGFRMEAVGPGPAAGRWCDALSRGYEIPTSVAALFGPVHSEPVTDLDGPMQWFGIYRDDRMVGTSMVACHDGLAGIYCVSTLPEERRKGVGAHATAVALRFAADQGYRVGVLQSSAMGKAIYERLGFRTLGSIPLWIRMPA